MTSIRVDTLASPSFTISDGRVLYGDAQSTSQRSYTPIKAIGDGSAGTVWIVDWHSMLPPNTGRPDMQCGEGVRPQWAGKTLVALKRMKRRYEGGWDECRQLKEIEALRAIPSHPNIVPFYDAFFNPLTEQLFLAFEPMEGNLSQLIKTRKGRRFAGGLISCIVRQLVTGLHHVHQSGYVHRKIRPETIMVTTTGLFEYQTLSPVPGSPPLERDVIVVIKLTSFGHAVEANTATPIEYVFSQQGYAAPEQLLSIGEACSDRPLDMWALGATLFELVTLKPLFPVRSDVEEMDEICKLLGDPSDEYGVDTRGAAIGGGRWDQGHEMARSVGYTFQKHQPKDFNALFDPSVPRRLKECISDLLKYDPAMRLTSQQCMEHLYIAEPSQDSFPRELEQQARF